MKINCNFKVSVVIPIYNSELYIHQLLDSVINQTYKNLEIILIDDGSPDKSGEICDNYSSKDSRIIVKHNRNEGGCSARNEGIDIASGDYIMFVDGDDWLASDFVEYMLDTIISTNSDMALSKFNFTTNDLNQTQQSDKKEVWSPERAVVAITLPEIAIGCWNKLYKISLIRKYKIRFDVPWYGEGLYFSTMAAAYSNHVGVGNRKVYYYRRNNPISATTLYNVMNAKNAIWNIVNIKKKIPFKTSRSRWSINQHIRGNYFEALEAIIGSKCLGDNVVFFLLCWIKFIIYTPIVILEGTYSKREIFEMIKKSINPFPSINFNIQQRLTSIEKYKKEQRSKMQ